MKKKIVIIGAGITGLSAGHFLNHHNIIIEKDNKCGGYCKTIKKNGFVWDYAGHFLHFKNKKIYNFVRSLFFNEELINIKKKAQVYVKHRLIDTPYQQNFYQVSILTFFLSIIHLLFKKKYIENNLKNKLMNEYGKKICEDFMISYNEKLYKKNTKFLSPSAFGRFLPNVSLLDMLMGVIKKKKFKTYNDNFIQPKHGIYELIKKFKNLVTKKNKKKILLNSEILRVDLNQKKLFLKNKIINYDILINTSPLNKFLQISNLKNKKKLIKVFSTNIIYVFNLGFSIKKIPDFNWVYFPEKKYIFHRIGCYNKTYRSENLSLFVEVSFSCSSEKKINKKILLKKILKNLIELKLINQENDLISSSILRMNPAYVHIKKNTVQNVKKITNELKKKDVYTIGRYGQWKYCSIEDNIIDAQILSKNLNDIDYSANL